MTHNEAKVLDFILKHQIDGIFDYDTSSVPSDNDSKFPSYDELYVAGNYLENIGFGKYLSKSQVKIYPEGASFAKDKSFYLDLLEQEDRQRKQDLLTETTLKAAAREPIYRRTTVILTIITILLTILSIYLKVSC